MLSPYFAILAALINVYSDALYAYDTLRGRNKPNKVTWALWSLAPLVAFAAQLEKGVGLQTALTLSVGVAPMLVLAASFRNKAAYWAIRRPDIVCGLVSLAALVVLVMTKQAVLAIILSMVADFFAGLPTLLKAWRRPETETAAPYFYGVLATVITLLTIKHWHFADYGFVVYILFMDSAIGAGAAGLRRRLAGRHADA